MQFNMNGQTYHVIQFTQHWRRLHGAWYRDVWARDEQGRECAISIRDEVNP